MEIGDWVKSHYQGEKIIGFVSDISNDVITIYTTIPKHFNEIKVIKDEVWLADDILSPDEISMLIDFTLDNGDKEWFKQLSDELKLWKPVECLGQVIVLEGSE